MLAKCDPGPEEVEPWELACRVYNSDFQHSLSERFGFELPDQSSVEELIRIAHQYIIGRRAEGDRDQLLSPMRKDYQRLLKSVRQFKEELVTFREEQRDISYEMRVAARALGEPKPLTEFAELSDHQKLRGEPYYFELLRLLKVLDYGIENQVQTLAPPKGRPRNNHGLDLCMPTVSDFWVDVVGRDFTVDYHQGAGISEAFEFCKALIDPLDTVPDTHIVTAMREEIQNRKESYGAI